MFGAYVHIPFCRTLCPYCDFFSVGIAGAVPEGYVEALCAEIFSFPHTAAISTVFFGGGTPSLLKQAHITRVLGALRDRFGVAGDAEISIEANPDDVTAERAAEWERAGVNRVSLGVQSFDDATLRYLGRRHDGAGARRACVIVADVFDNWGMDLIFGAPPVGSWDATLGLCLELGPKHVSAYGLTYEAQTPFAARSHEGVDDETWLRLYRQCSAKLSGYDHYEISNYAVEGYQCRHNLAYWRNEEYAGFGAGAYSLVGGVRGRNPADIERYAASPGVKEESVCLDEREVRVETLIQHFRLRAGIEKAAYQRRFGHDVRPEFAESVDRLVGRGLLWEDAARIAPTAQGFELNDEIGLEIVG